MHSPRSASAGPRSQARSRRLKAGSGICGRAWFMRTPGSGSSTGTPTLPRSPASGSTSGSSCSGRGSSTGSSSGRLRRGERPMATAEIVDAELGNGPEAAKGMRTGFGRTYGTLSRTAGLWRRKAISGARDRRFSRPRLWTTRSNHFPDSLATDTAALPGSGGAICSLPCAIRSLQWS
jgi:hypothetical protein